ncbi:hypothetical protein ACOME3_002704 [Neoechinorhynchus agilis]
MPNRQIRDIGQNAIVQEKGKSHIRFNDELYTDQWNLGNEYSDVMNIQEAWSHGLTGKDVIICIVDDGVDYRHPELNSRYKPEASYDFNEIGGDKDPIPVHTHRQNNHGTKCAGIAVAEANNGICGVGVAYGASLAAIRLIDGPLNPIMESRAMAYMNQKIHIKSSSWGPTDDGETMDKMDPIVERSIEIGCKKGRQGRGILYVWAAGNGGDIDHCGADGYNANPNIFSITSVNQTGHREYYTEAGTNIIAATFVGRGATHENKYCSGVITTDIDGRCAENFKGTSAATPLAAGIFALLLEAQPELTYRDVMHLIVKTARKPNKNDELWFKNAAGHMVHRYIGFGTLDAGEMVKHGRTWQHVPSRKHCNRFVPVDAIKKTENNTIFIRWKFRLADCAIKKIEHATLRLSVQTDYRGGTRIDITSPLGTPSTLLNFRWLDLNDEGIKQHPFTTNRCWGEDPNGVWTLELWLKGKRGSLPTAEHLDINEFITYGT